MLEFLGQPWTRYVAGGITGLIVPALLILGISISAFTVRVFGLIKIYPIKYKSNADKTMGR